jgi:hypothetical protein
MRIVLAVNILLMYIHVGGPGRQRTERLSLHTGVMGQSSEIENGLGQVNEFDQRFAFYTLENCPCPGNYQRDLHRGIIEKGPFVIHAIQPALFADSAAATPFKEPLPNSSGFFEKLFTCP